MGFVEINLDEEIEKNRQKSTAFRKAWDESREEYALIGEMISLRKKEKITQSKLAKMTGSRQQAISRIENKEIKPSLRVFCNILSAMGYELKIVKKSNAV